MTSWNMPPGCNVSDIPGNEVDDDVMRCLVCGRFCDATGFCRPPRTCAAMFERRELAAVEAAIADDAETERLLREQPLDLDDLPPGARPPTQGEEDHARDMVESGDREVD